MNSKPGAAHDIASDRRMAESIPEAVKFPTPTTITETASASRMGRSPTVRRPNGVALTVGYFLDRSIPEPNTGCWYWTGALTKHGYGSVRLKGRSTGAHRASYEAATGIALQSEIDVCHRCDVPFCVNPQHLFVGTRADNMQDCVSKGRLKVPGLAGEQCPNSKLVASQVIAIRSDARSQRAIAREYGIDKKTVSLIKRGLTWRSV